MYFKRTAASSFYGMIAGKSLIYVSYSIEEKFVTRDQNRAISSTKQPNELKIWISRFQDMPFRIDTIRTIVQKITSASISRLILARLTDGLLRASISTVLFNLPTT